MSLCLWQGCHEHDEGLNSICSPSSYDLLGHNNCEPIHKAIRDQSTELSRLEVQIHEREEDQCSDHDGEQDWTATTEDEDDDVFDQEEWPTDEGREDTDEGGDHTDNDTRDSESNGALLAIGDSVLDWNRYEGNSIPDVVGRYTQLEIVNESIGGSQMLDMGSGGITQQYISNHWTWVLIDGGANDVGDGCGCGECLYQVDQIISADTSQGQMVDLVDRALSDGAQVILLGYYSVHSPDFAGCEEELVAINTRYQRLAEQNSSVFYIQMSDAFARPSATYMDDDGIHPSIEGSRVIGQIIAQKIIAETISN